MSAKSSRRARAMAYGEAQRSKLWQRGEAEAFHGLKGLLRRLFARRRWTDIVGDWHKANLKRFAKIAATYVRSGQAERDYLERRRFAKLQRRAAVLRQKERKAKAKEEEDAIYRRLVEGR
jgi:hypothetical protein